MKKWLFTSVTLLGLLCSFSSVACITPWRGDKKVSKKPSPLHVAVEEGSLLKVKFALKMGADINQKQHVACRGYITNHGSTPLARAVSNGNIEIAQYLIDKGADIVHIEDYSDDIRLFHLDSPLLDENAPVDVNKQSSTENKAPIWHNNPKAKTLFAYANTGEMVHFLARMFKEKGVLERVVAHENKRETNAAFQTVFRCQENMLKTFLSYGIKPNRKGLLLRLAVMDGRVDGDYSGSGCPSSFISQLIEQFGEIEDMDQKDKVFAKILYKYPELVQKFVEKNPNLKIDLNASVDNGGETPLDIAVRKKDVKLLSFLIERGAKSEKALMIAVNEDNFEMVKLLVKGGADVNVQDRNGYTPLHAALKNGRSRTDIALFLIENGADVNMQDSVDGNAALHFSSVYEEPKLFEKIIQAGANLELANMDGNKPYHIARRYLKEDKLKLLETKTSIKKGLPCNGIDFVSKDEKGQTALHTIADVQLAKCIIRYGADINALNNEGQPPLFTQLFAKNKDTFKLLWSMFKSEYRAKNPNKINQDKSNIHQDNLGNTIFHYLGMHSDNICDYVSCSSSPFSAFSATDMNIQNKEGKTPLHYAFEYGHLERLLIDQKIDVNIRDNNGRTPIFYINKFDYRNGVNFDLNVKDNDGNTPLVYIKDVYTFEKFHSKGMRYPEKINLSSKKAQEANTSDLVRKKIKTLFHLKDAKSAKILIQSVTESTPEFYQQFLNNKWDKKFWNFVLDQELIDVKGEMGKDLLFTALENKDLSFCKKLIQKGADVNTKNSKGETLLDCVMLSNIDKKRTFVEFLINQGVDVNNIDNNGQTILDKILQKSGGYVRVFSDIDFLVSLGAKTSNVLKTTNQAQTGQLSTQKQTKSSEPLQRDGKEAKEMRANPMLEIALRSAIISRDTTKVEKLLNSGIAFRRMVGFNAIPFLQIVVFQGDVRMVQLVLDKLVDVSLSHHKDAAMPLFSSALIKGKYDIAEAFLNHGLNVKDKSSPQGSVFKNMVYTSHLGAAKFLIKHGAGDVNEKYIGLPLFHYVVMKNQKDWVQLFLDNGVDVNIKDLHGKTVFELYRNTMTDEIRTMLEDYLAKK